MRGRGRMAASVSKNCDGSKQSARVPSRHGRRKRSSTLPSAVRSSASWATGGRRKYLHECSSRSVSPARTATLACRSKPALWPLPQSARAEGQLLTDCQRTARHGGEESNTCQHVGGENLRRCNTSRTEQCSSSRPRTHFKTAWSRVSGTEGSTPSLLRQPALPKKETLTADYADAIRLHGFKGPDPVRSTESAQSSLRAAPTRAH
jgi:hypothetical protein